jgi:hypothetical protein
MGQGEHEESQMRQDEHEEDEETNEAGGDK